MYNKHRESAGVEDFCLEANVEDDKFYETNRDDVNEFSIREVIHYAPFATHKRADGTRLTPVEASCRSSSVTSAKLGSKGNQADKNCVSPGDTVVQESEISSKAR